MNGIISMYANFNLVEEPDMNRCLKVITYIQLANDCASNLNQIKDFIVKIRKFYSV